VSVLRVHGVWKSYPDWGRQPRTLRGVFAGRVPVLGRGKRPQRWALRDLSLDLATGGSLGVIGHNGSGKSTFLRLAAGLGRPTRGAIATHQDTAAVLSLGSSFDMQLTGEENAYTAALVAGMTKREARTRMASMLEFSELGEFVEYPVRTYSEGMKLRLAFGVVAALEPRLLILDEVLAVGDLAFRQKCQDRIDELRESGTSLVVASHSFEEIAANCDEVAWLHRGELRALGEAEAVIERYEQAARQATLERTPVGSPSEGGLRLRENRFGSQEMTIESVDLAPAGPLRSGDPLRIRIGIRARDKAVDNPIVVVSLRRARDEAVVFDLSTQADGFSLGGAVEEAMVTLDLKHLDLLAGDYTIDVGVFEPDWSHAYDYHWQTYSLRIEGATGGKGLLAPAHRWEAEQ
jgi:lipopolysaccharide transport system ATP-binding protein